MEKLARELLAYAKEHGIRAQLESPHSYHRGFHSGMQCAYIESAQALQHQIETNKKGE